MKYGIENKGQILFRENLLQAGENTIFRKNMENAGKQSHINFVTGRRNYLVSEPNYHKTKRFSTNSLTIEMNKKM